MKNSNVYFFGTSEQIKKLEEMIEALPEKTILDRAEQTLTEHLHAQLLSSKCIELYPMGHRTIEITSPSIASCNEDYTEFTHSGFDYIIRYKEKKA
jgi:hypothetical protein